ncbi:MAG: ATP-binding protein, partial [Ktedonobacteraceae bacterium]
IFPASTWLPGLAAIETADRSKVRAELDGLIAHLYGLTEEEFQHILGTFPLVEENVKKAALETYRYYALVPDDLQLAEIIARGENAHVEFKVAVCWNAARNSKDEAMKDNVIEEVAAFLNTAGGMVLIGVKDDGAVVGLEDDYKAVNNSKPNRDGYQLFLLDILKNGLLGNNSLLYKISFGSIQGKDVCRIDISPAHEPVYLKNEDFYIREGNRKRKLTKPRDIVAYVKQRWH